MNSTKILEVKSLYKKYHTLTNEIDVLNNINFSINKNDFVALIGPSGCGKSSILNIISNQDKNYDGQVIIKDNIKIGYMFQEDTLFPWLTVYQNAILGLKITKSLNKDNINYVEKLLKKYNLYSFKDNYPTSLSGGMKQRLSLIRTLAIKPDLLLLDEPFSALDYETKLQVRDDVYKILKEENITMLIVTHDIEEAKYLCNKIIVLSKRPSSVIKIINRNQHE